jgi:hypothetical protein
VVDTADVGAGAYEAVGFCLKNMQGPTTLILEQYVMLRNLVTNLKLLLEVEGPVSTEDVTTRSAGVRRVTRGSYPATRVSIRNVVADLAQFALIRWRAPPDNGKRELENSIVVLFLYAIESISSIAAECDSSNGVTSDKLPPPFHGTSPRLHRESLTRWFCGRPTVSLLQK